MPHVYRLHTSRGVIGPVKIDTVRDLADAGLLSPSTLVARDDGPPLELTAIPELCSLVAAFGAEESTPVYAGDLAVTSFLRIMQRMYAMGLTGVMVLRDATRRKDVHLERGDPVFVASTIGKERLGELLVAHGKLSSDALRAALARSRDDELPLGEAIERLGLLDKREIYAALRAQQLDRLGELCAWEHGSYSFYEGVVYRGPRINLKLTTPELWVHAARTLPERIILRRLGDILHQTVVGFDHETLKLCYGQLSLTEQQMLNAFDAERAAVQVITSESKEGKPERRRAALTVLYLLFEIGGIRLRSSRVGVR